MANFFFNQDMSSERTQTMVYISLGFSFVPHKEAKQEQSRPLGQHFTVFLSNTSRQRKLGCIMQIKALYNDP